MGGENSFSAVSVGDYGNAGNKRFTILSVFRDYSQLFGKIIILQSEVRRCFYETNFRQGKNTEI